MKPGGRINPLFLAVLAVLTAAGLGAGAWLIQHARTPIQVKAGPWTLRETHRELTGQQRSTRVLFAEEGKMLAVLCPRYNKVLTYRVTQRQTLEPRTEIALKGRPVAMAMAGQFLVVLERPPGDDKHLMPGWWEAFRSYSTQSYGRVPAGYYPDDLAVTPDGKYLLVLSSGQAEGDKKKPLPCLDVYSMATPGGSALCGAFAADGGEDVVIPNVTARSTPVGHLDLEPADDADRLVISHMGKRALITLPKAKQSVAINLFQPESPRVAGRLALPETGAPYVSVADDGDWMIMPTMQVLESAVIERPVSPKTEDARPSPGYLAYTMPEESAVELAAFAHGAIGRFPVKGALNLGGSEPSGLAFCSERGLIAITTKPGTVHLVSIRSRLGSETDPTRIANARETISR